MSTISNERLEELANGDMEVWYSESQSMATELLALRKERERAEPVAYISKADLDAGYPHILARKEYSKACPMAVYSAPPAPVVPKIDRKAICNKVHWLCARAPGATFYNAAEYTLDEVIEMMAPRAPAVPDCLQRLLKHAEGLTFGSDWNNGTAAKYHRDALIQAVKDCRAAMLSGGYNA